MTRIAIATERNSLCMRHPSNTSGRALTPCHDLTSCGLPDHTTHLAKGHHPTPTDALPASGSTRTRIDTEAVEQRFAPVRCDPACSNPPAHVAFTRASCLRLSVRGDCRSRVCLAGDQRLISPNTSFPAEEPRAPGRRLVRERRADWEPRYRARATPVPPPSPAPGSP